MLMLTASLNLFMQMQFEQGISCAMLIYGSQIGDTLISTTHFPPCVHILIVMAAYPRVILFSS